MPNDATVSYDEEPDHMIIWLDVTIGEREEYKHLKKAFSSTADPKNETPVSLLDRDHAEILQNEGLLPVTFEGIPCLLAAFKDIDECIKCFEQNHQKRIFFITSGTLGEKAVPKILENFQDAFIDPETNEPYTSIYVYCHNIGYHMQWALEYRDYIQIFNHDADLLVRMIRDMASYFVMISKRLIEEDPPNNSSAYHRLRWAHELYTRYSKMETDSLREEFKELDLLIKGVEDDLKSSSSDEEDS